MTQFSILASASELDRWADRIAPAGAALPVGVGGAASATQER